MFSSLRNIYVYKYTIDGFQHLQALRSVNTNTSRCIRIPTPMNRATITSNVYVDKTIIDDDTMKTTHDIAPHLDTTQSGCPRTAWKCQESSSIYSILMKIRRVNVMCGMPWLVVLHRNVMATVGQYIAWSRSLRFRPSPRVMWWLSMSVWTSCWWGSWSWTSVWTAFRCFGLWCLCEVIVTFGWLGVLKTFLVELYLDKVWFFTIQTLFNI